jgi:hypothetical protein
VQGHSSLSAELQGKRVDIVGYWNVLKRRRFIVAVGVILSTLLAAFALLRVSSEGVAYRSPSVYVGEATLFVTAMGFPWGRTSLPSGVENDGGSQRDEAVVEPGRLEYLAALYTEFTRSEESYEAQGLFSEGRALPLIRLRGFSESSERAVAIVNRAATALRDYVARNQEASEIASNSRVLLPTITAAQEAEIFKGAHITTPMMILILGLAITVLVAFMRDNIQRSRSFARSEDRPKPVEPETLGARATVLHAEASGRRAELRRAE